MRSAPIMLLLAALAGCNPDTQVTQPDQELNRVNANLHYQVTKYPSLGGTLSRGMASNKKGIVAGWSNQADGTRRAALWQNGSATSLGTLGGPHSTVPWPGLNDDGMVVGISQTGDIDPLDESWSCEEGGFLPQVTNLVCRGFVYSQGGPMRELPTLGGTHGFATAINNRNLAVGWSETPVHDPTCVGVQVLQFRATVWEIGNRIRTRQLPPFPGDSASAATAINDNGQVVGISGDCDQAVGRFSARHAVLWNRNGTLTEIPNLGGVTWHTPMDINSKGDVVGFSNPPGAGDPLGDFISHAFLWINGAVTATDLGTLPGDLFSEAFAMNNRGQVVGVSFGGVAGSHGFLYQNGVMLDLNSVLQVGPDILQSAQDINDAGQITGRIKDAVTGQTLMFVATPLRK